MALETDPVGGAADSINKPPKTASSQAQEDLSRRTAALNLQPNTKTPGTGVSNAVFRPDAERKRYVQVQSPAQAQPQPQRVPAPKQTPGAGQPTGPKPEGKVIKPDVQQWKTPAPKGFQWRTALGALARTAGRAAASAFAEAVALPAAILVATTTPAGPKPIEGNLPGGPSYRIAPESRSLDINDAAGKPIFNPWNGGDGVFRAPDGTPVARYTPDGKGIEFDPDMARRLATPEGQKDLRERYGPGATASAKPEDKPKVDAKPEAKAGEQPKAQPKPETERCEQASGASGSNNATVPPTQADIARLVAEHSQDKQSPPLTEAAAWSIVTQTQPAGTKAEVVGKNVIGPDIYYHYTQDQCDKDGKPREPATVQVTAIAGLDGFDAKLSKTLKEEEKKQRGEVAHPAKILAVQVPNGTSVEDVKKLMGRYWGVRSKKDPTGWTAEASQHAGKEIIVVDESGKVLLRAPVFDPEKAK